LGSSRRPQCVFPKERAAHEQHPENGASSKARLGSSRTATEAPTSTLDRSRRDVRLARPKPLSQSHWWASSKRRSSHLLRSANSWFATSLAAGGQPLVAASGQIGVAADTRRPAVVRGREHHAVPLGASANVSEIDVLGRRVPCSLRPRRVERAARRCDSVALRSGRDTAAPAAPQRALSIVARGQAAPDASRPVSRAAPSISRRHRTRPGRGLLERCRAAGRPAVARGPDDRAAGLANDHHFAPAGPSRTHLRTSAMDSQRSRFDGRAMLASGRGQRRQCHSIGWLGGAFRRVGGGRRGGVGCVVVRGRPEGVSQHGQP
jgi:hypothetical protein